MADKIKLDYVDYKGKKYPIRDFEFKSNGKSLFKTIGSEELEKALFPENGKIDESVTDYESIDSRIAYYVPEEKLKSLDENQMLDYIYENIDEHIYGDFGNNIEDEKHEKEYSETLKNAAKKLVRSSNSDTYQLYSKREDKIYRDIIKTDPDPINPREFDEGNIGTLVYGKRTLNGDETVSDIEEYMRDSIEHDWETRIVTKFTIPDLEALLNKPELERFIRKPNKNLGVEIGVYKDDIIMAAEDSLDGLHDKVRELSEKIFGSEDKIELTFDAPYMDADNGGRFKDDDCTVEIKVAAGLDINLEFENEELENGINEILEEAKQYIKDFAYTERFTDREVEDKNESLSKGLLFEKFKATKAAALPVGYSEHGGECSTFISSDADYLCGVIFVEKDNPDYLAMLKGEARDSDGKVYNKWKPMTEEEAAKWAEGCLKGEVETYDHYVQNEVYGVTTELWDEETRSWDEVDSVWGFYPDNSKQYLEAYADIIANASGINPENLISLEQAIELTSDSEEKTLNMFFKTAAKLLPEYNNNPTMAVRTQIHIWDENGNQDRANVVRSFINLNCENPRDYNMLLIEKMNVMVEPGNIYNIAKMVLPPADISNHGSDLYIASSPYADKLIEKLNQSADGIKSGMIKEFTDQVTHRKSYELPFCYMEEHIRERNGLTNVQKLFEDYMQVTGLTPKELMDYTESAGPGIPDSQAKNLSGIQWWKKSLLNAMQAGGATYLDPREEINLLERNGIIPKGSYDNNFDYYYEDAKSQKILHDNLFAVIQGNPELRGGKDFSKNPTAERLKEKEDPEIGR